MLFFPSFLSCNLLKITKKPSCKVRAAQTVYHIVIWNVHVFGDMENVYIFLYLILTCCQATFILLELELQNKDHTVRMHIVSIKLILL